VAGLAAEFCVAFTARDAVDLGFTSVILEDATKALSGESYAKTAAELRQRGIGLDSVTRMRNP
jgi:nicotinamidase/pyrazinamidase